MNRHFLALIGVITGIVLAGCIGQVGGGSSGSAADVKLTNFTAPEDVEMSRNIPLNITAQNGGGEARSFRSGFSVDKGEGWRQVSVVEFPVKSGYRSSRLVELAINEVQENVRFRLDAYNRTVTVDIVPYNGRIGETLTMHDTANITIRNVEVGFSYRWKARNGTILRTSLGNDRKYVFVQVAAENIVDEMRTLPRATEFRLVVGDQQFSPGQFQLSPYNRPAYRGGNVHPGVERIGWLFFQVPADISREDIRVAWSRITEDSRKIAYWR